MASASEINDGGETLNFIVYRTRLVAAGVLRSFVIYRANSGSLLQQDRFVIYTTGAMHIFATGTRWNFVPGLVVNRNATPSYILRFQRSSRDRVWTTGNVFYTPRETLDGNCSAALACPPSPLVEDTRS